MTVGLLVAFSVAWQVTCRPASNWPDDLEMLKTPILLARDPTDLRSLPAKRQRSGGNQRQP